MNIPEAQATIESKISELNSLIDELSGLKDWATEAAGETAGYLGGANAVTPQLEETSAHLGEACDVAFQLRNKLEEANAALAAIG